MMLNKTKHDISVRCTKGGYQDATGYLKSGTEGSTFGNILAGGVIGWGIDSAAGADNKYPDVTTITLVPVGAVEPAVATTTPTKATVMNVATTATEKKPKSPPATTLEGRLRKLDDLHQKKLISDEDYKRAREKIVGEL